MCVYNIMQHNIIIVIVLQSVSFKLGCLALCIILYYMHVIIMQLTWVSLLYQTTHVRSAVMWGWSWMSAYCNTTKYYCYGILQQGETLANE